MPGLQGRLMIMMTSHDMCIKRVFVATFGTADITTKRFVQSMTPHVDREENCVTKVDVAVHANIRIVARFNTRSELGRRSSDDAIVTCRRRRRTDWR